MECLWFWQCTERHCLYAWTITDTYTIEMHSPLWQWKLAMSHNTVYNVSTELTWPCWTPGNVHGTASACTAHAQQIAHQQDEYALCTIATFCQQLGHWQLLCFANLLSLSPISLYIISLLLQHHESPSHFFFFQFMLVLNFMDVGHVWVIVGFRFRYI